ncbi:Predicted membrane protein [Plasmopara halstedii]|uniref:Predicted membrane protein n=1 Tax=Plasmopara halstedii TaxID=4781 RepID=A0A0P1ATZ7_PLAHL|nr:Predicted membrane protein [Plasmopara halstedii]CEG44442.1 Predicted membrane protein [Plasmopara halstedii]|eukprot:XP_024580811.1 Predicted membrane protein [Plasmopara halstedii]
MAFFGKLLIAAGTLLLIHAGYYSVQYESYVKLTETADAQMPPTEVVVELVVAFFISLVGVLLTCGEILPIRSNDAMHSRSLATVISNPDFHVFNHRGHSLHQRVMS